MSRLRVEFQTGCSCTWVLRQEFLALGQAQRKDICFTKILVERPGRRNHNVEVVLWVHQEPQVGCLCLMLSST